VVRSALALVALVALAAPAAGAPAIAVEDDIGQRVELPAPARRIVSLAPHATEMLFAVDAGDRIVGAAAYSDYPPAARTIPRVGGSAGVDLERIVALRPDLIVAWASGTPARAVARLRDLGFPVYTSEPRRLEHIARSLERLGRLVGKGAHARARAEAWRDRVRELRARFAGRPAVRVFYQILDPQLITVNGEHLISEVLELCGAQNVFADLPALAPPVTLEAVLHRNPDAILAGGTAAQWRVWEARWREQEALRAVRRDALFFVPADLLHRLGPRVLEGAERVCRALEQARRRR